MKRFTVRTMRKHGSDDDLYFKTWAQVIKYMKKARKFKGENQAEYFTIFFGE
jgi:hypothetical protein